MKLNAIESLDQFALFADLNGCPGDWEDWDITIREALEELDALKTAAHDLAQVVIVSQHPFHACLTCFENSPDKAIHISHTPDCPAGTVLALTKKGGEDMSSQRGEALLLLIIAIAVIVILLSTICSPIVLGQ